MTVESVFDPRPEEVMAAKVLGAGEIDPLDPERDPASEQDTILVALQKRVNKLRREERDLKERLSIISPELVRFEKALKVLRGEPLTGVKGQGNPKTQARIKHNISRIGPNKLEEIRKAVLKLADANEEFRQVDLRAVYDIGSSQAAVAFEMLRQENTIRLARKSGNNKYFRLTREALTREEVKDG